MENSEDYEQKAKNIFNLLNRYRTNPRELSRHLEKLKKYLDPSTNILSEPNKVQIQMVEGEKVFDEAIHFLRNLKPLTPLIWDSNLALSAQEHVSDIGPKGLLLYQSSDGTEPEERISKYGSYSSALGENIDFGPNDALGVVVSLTLDDGEETRPHRENLFKAEYRKVGIACGTHTTEFQMCVMDFADEFEGKDKKGNEDYVEQEDERVDNENRVEEDNLNRNQNMDMMVDNERYKENEIDSLARKTKNIINSKKVVKKTVEILTKITYKYEDGSTREVEDKTTHVFNE